MGIESNYPAGVGSFVSELGDRILSIDGVTSVLLAGSGGRGELTVFSDRAGWRILGDLELLVVCGRPVQGLDIEREISDLRSNSTHGYSTAPRIDYSAIATRDLPRLQKKLWVFETKSSACCIAGDSTIIGLLPTVTIENLDYSELNELFLHRLLALAKAFQPYVHHDTDLSGADLVYAVARNSLDVLTWLLPYEGVMYPTYAMRAEYLRSSDRLSFLASMSDGFRERIDLYTAIKLNNRPIEVTDSVDLTSCLGDLIAASRWVESRTEQKVLGRYRRKRRFLQASMVAFQRVTSGQTSPAAAMRWLTRDTYSLHAEALIHILRQIASGTPVLEEWSDRSRQFLDSLVPWRHRTTDSDPVALAKDIASLADANKGIING